MRKERVQEEAPIGFDFKVTHRDEKTGLIVRKNAYTMHILGDERKQVMERPKGSGNCWDAQNEPCGRIALKGKGRQAKLSYDPDAKHIAWSEPETADQKLARETAKTNSENAALKAELAALKAEQKPKAPAAAATKPKES
jgi:hypothetical protein